jgi:hypothetical protein
MMRVHSGHRGKKGEFSVMIPIEGRYSHPQHGSSRIRCADRDAEHRNAKQFRDAVVVKLKAPLTGRT